MRTILRVTVSLFGVLVFVVAAVLGINAFDQDLSADARRLLAAPTVVVAPSENLYVAMVGFNAPADVQMATAGQMRIAAHQLGAPVEYADALSAPLRFHGKADFCNPARASCIEAVRTHAVAVLQMAVDNVELYRRYLQLHDLPRFAEAPSQSRDTPSMQVPLEVRNLFLAYTLWRVKHATATDERAAALADLGRDIRTWRRMLTGEGGIAAKMTAIGYLHADYALLADIIGDRDIDIAPHADEVEAMFDAVRAADWQIAAAFEPEFRLSARVYDDLRAKKRAAASEASGLARYTDLGAAYFFLPNATQNLNAAHMRQFQQLARTEPRLYRTASLGLDQWRKDRLELQPNWIHNPAGKMLLSLDATKYEQHILSAYDIAVFQQLVRMAYDLRMQQVPAAQVSAYLERFPDRARHPVDGDWFVWTPATAELAMQPLGKQPHGRRFSVPVVTGS